MRRLSVAFLMMLALSSTTSAAEIRQFTTDLPPNTIVPPNPQPGFLDEVVAEAHKRAGLPFQPEFLPWMRAQETALHVPNALIFGIARTVEREGAYRWIAELSVQRSRFIRFGEVAAVNSLDEARTATVIGVQTGTPRHTLLRSLGFLNLEPNISDEVNVRKLAAGHIDTLFDTDIRFVYECEKLGIQDKIVFGRPITEEHIWLAANPAFPDDIAARLAAAVASIKADGTFAGIRAAYIRNDHQLVSE